MNFTFSESSLSDIERLDLPTIVGSSSVNGGSCDITRVTSTFPPQRITPTLFKPILLLIVCDNATATPTPAEGSINCTKIKKEGEGKKQL